MQNFRSKAATDIELRFFMKEKQKKKAEDEEDEESVKIMFACISYLM